jgi:deazaflavin-dependent oxidoreductase (nitroreductase family)
LLRKTLGSFDSPLADSSSLSAISSSKVDATLRKRIHVRTVRELSKFGWQGTGASLQSATHFVPSLESSTVAWDNAPMSTMQLRFLKAIGESSFWKRAGRLHTRLYRATGGRIGHNAGQITNLLLTTLGRKSGELRTVPLAYLEDGDSYVVVASNGGADRHPAWWLNLRKQPDATVEIGKRKLPVRAALATAAERDRLWPKLTEVNPFYSRYEQITDRQIPVVILRPKSS